MLTWQSAQISPGTVSIAAAIDILAIAIVGGLRDPIGPFVGAFLCALLKAFAVDVLVALGLLGERFQLLIGMGFFLGTIVERKVSGRLGFLERWPPPASVLPHRPSRPATVPTPSVSDRVSAASAPLSPIRAARFRARTCDRSFS